MLKILPAQPTVQHIALSDLEFHRFRNMLYKATGISLSDAKRPLVAGRLARRLHENGLASYSAYFQMLMRDSAELQIAVDLLTTNETYFFREPRHFDFLCENILPALHDNSGPLRIWSGACSSGEEPYTLAMLLAQHRSHRSWEIVASDISSRMLDRARRGQYPLDEADAIPADIRRRYCFKGVDENTGKFIVDPVLAANIRFMQINLNAALPDIGEFDVIFLRNVMIYFDMRTKIEVVQRLLPHLKPGGYFIVSHSESLNGITDALTPVKPSIYRNPV